MTIKADKSKEVYMIHLDSKEAFNPVLNILLINRIRRQGSNTQLDNKLACLQSQGMTINVKRR